MNLLEREADVLKGSEVGEKIVGLEDDAELLAMGTEAGFIGRNEVPIDSDLTGVRQFESGEEAQESRFSTARGAY